MSRPEFLVEVTARPADGTHCESEDGEHRCEFVGYRHDDPPWCGLFCDEIPPVTGLENMRRSHARGRTRPWAYAQRDGRTWRDGRPILSEEQRQRAREMRASGAPLKRIAAELGIGISHAHRITSSGGSP